MNSSPYPGLRPFRSEEAHIFFGREEQTDQLLEKLSDTRFIAIVGPSGCGKSSLARAGIIPALKSGYLAQAGTEWRTIVMQPGSSPISNLTKAVFPHSALGQEHSATSSQDTLSEEEKNSLLLASLRSSPLGLVDVLRNTAFPAHTNILLLIDQFEEIFRYYRQGNRDETEAFVALLSASARQQEVPVSIVLTLRSDFFGECALFNELPEMINSGQFLVPRMSREQQRMAIIGPAGVFGSTVEPRLVNYLLNEMGRDPDQLPLLQHCLMRMWLRTLTKQNINKETLQPVILGSQVADGVTIILQEYEVAGSLKNALSNHAEEAFAELNDKQKHIAEELFRCLSERGPYQLDRRRPALLSEVVAIAGVSVSEVIDVVKVFCRPDRRFLTFTIPLSLDTVLDISHESLIRQWRRLNMWVEREAESAETYRHLEKTACRWNQKEAALWSSPDLDITLTWKEREKPTAEWAKRYGSHFELAIEFLDASVMVQEERKLREQFERQKRFELERERELQKEREHRKDLTLKLISIGFILVLILAGWALWERANAEKAKMETGQALVEAEEARRIAVYEQNRAEEQRQQALEVEKKAREAQKEAELNSAGFTEMINSIFGFLSGSKQNKEFLEWAQKTSTIEKLTPALHLMIDSSESMNREEKEYWHKVLSDTSWEHKLELLNILGAEFIEKEN